MQGHVNEGNNMLKEDNKKGHTTSFTKLVIHKPASFGFEKVEFEMTIIFFCVGGSSLFPPFLYCALHSILFCTIFKYNLLFSSCHFPCPEFALQHSGICYRPTTTPPPPPPRPIKEEEWGLN